MLMVTPSGLHSARQVVEGCLQTCLQTSCGRDGFVKRNAYCLCGAVDLLCLTFVFSSLCLWVSWLCLCSPCVHCDYYGLLPCVLLLRISFCLIVYVNFGGPGHAAHCHSSFLPSFDLLMCSIAICVCILEL
jgi:hypothetical protein